MRLGKKPAREGSIKLKFGTFFNKAALPTPPARFGHIDVGQPWGVLGNEDYSDCVFAGAAHETMVWRGMGGVPQSMFGVDDVLADYSAVTGFDRARPDTDQGSDMQEAAAYRQKTGVLDSSGVRHKVDAYVSLRPGHPDDLATATYITGAVGVGLRFPVTAMDQFDGSRPWTVVPGAKVEGGHYVPCVGRNSKGHFMVVTWGRLHAMTPEFFSTYCDEAVVYVSLEALRGTTTPDGFDETALRTSLRQFSA